MLKKIIMGAGAAVIIMASAPSAPFAKDDGSLDFDLNKETAENDDGGLKFDLSKGSLRDLKNRFKVDRSKPLRIHIPGIIDVNYKFRKNRDPDCQDLYRDMVKSGTNKAKETYHEECLDD